MAKFEGQNFFSKYLSESTYPRSKAIPESSFMGNLGPHANQQQVLNDVSYFDASILPSATDHPDQNCQEPPAKAKLLEHTFSLDKSGPATSSQKAPPLTNPIASVTLPKREAENGSMESNMAILYESLQGEAKKIQKFKVQAMAQIKQKTEEIALKQQQLKALSLELNESKAANSELMTRIKRQERHNEEVLNRVVTTRDICYSLNKRCEDLQHIVNIGEEALRNLNIKSNRQAEFTRMTLEELDEYKKRTTALIDDFGKEVQLREQEFLERTEKLKADSLSLVSQIQQKDYLVSTLNGKLDETQGELLKKNQQFQSLSDAFEQKQRDMENLLNECMLTKTAEVNEVMTKMGILQERSSIQREELLSDINQLHQALASLSLQQTELFEILELEQMKNSQLSAEKASQQTQIYCMESKITQIEAQQVAIGCELELRISKIGELETQISKLKNDATQCEAAVQEKERIMNEARMQQENSLREKDEAILDLNIKLSSTMDGYVQLTETMKVMQSSNTHLTSLLKSAEEDVASQVVDITNKTAEISKLKEEIKETMRTAQHEKSQDQLLLEIIIEKHRLELERKAQDSQLLNSEYELEKLKSREMAECNTARIHSLMDDLSSRNAKIDDLNASLIEMQFKFAAALQQKEEVHSKVEAELQNALDSTQRLYEDERARADELREDLNITRKSLDQSLQEKNDVACDLAEKTTQLQEMSNKLLVKDCEFNKLMSAVQNLKSKCAAVATPIVSASNQAAVKPSQETVAMKAREQQSPSVYQQQLVITTPKTNKVIPSVPLTPRTTPRNSSELPRGILRNEGSGSKPNRVVFSTPIDQKAVVPSDSDTSVVDLQLIKNTARGKLTPKGTPVKLHDQSLGAAIQSHTSTNEVTPTQVAAKSLSLGKNRSRDTSTEYSPLPHTQNSGSSGERLPRSKMLKYHKKRSHSNEKRDDLDPFTAQILKKHRNAVHGIKSGPSKESDSDCFGFASD